MTVGGGRPKVIRGRRRRKRHGTVFQGPPAWRPGLSVEGTERRRRYSPRRRRQRERVYGASLHGQDSTDDRLATPVLPRLPLLRPTPGAKSGLTVNRRGSRTGHNDIDSATRAPVPKARERGSPLCDSATAAEGGNTRTPTKATRRHAKVAREGCRGERMRKDGKRLEGLKIEDTREEVWKGQRTLPPRQPGGTPRSLVKGVREEAQKESESDIAAECDGTCGGASVAVEGRVWQWRGECGSGGASVAVEGRVWQWRGECGSGGASVAVG
ncbi:hypothetical protein H4582DRAFT_2065658 [Lactarius indigo]|nr:hypothetical protein H4582DRAFT_2065658 [Lactarius indigo]